MSSTLPHTVEVWLNDVYSQLETDGFFNENDLALLSKEESFEIFREIIGGAALDTWMDTGDVNLGPDDLTRLLFEIMLRAHVEVLKKEGFIDSMFDDEGNEHLWMTEKGKKKMEELQEEFHSLLVDSGLENDYTDESDLSDDDPFLEDDEV
tara:strand:- start:1151 stop:1603 length:453 start_codon:yes stop_codon:yes gene_type:complete